jgi:hypothetical protein
MSINNSKNSVADTFFSILNLFGFDAVNIEKQHKISLNR